MSWEPVVTLAMLAILGLMLYAWGGYPFLLALWRTERERRPEDGGGARPAPTVAAIVAAHNEETHIGARIDNLIARTPDGVSLAIHVGVDGGGDRTAEVARERAAAHSNVHVHAFAERRGKVAVIKDLARAASAELLLFTDANTEFLPGAVEALLPHFADPRVGGVCGRLVLTRLADGRDREYEDLLPAALSPRAGEEESEESFYWLWETGLKVRESAVDSCLGANGAIFMLRRELFWREIPERTMVDDFVIGMKVREQGFRMVYEPAAAAVEELPELRDEWRRRVRIGTGDYQAIVLCRRCLGPRYGRFAVMFWSHKVLRWFTPHAAILLVLGALALAAGDYLPGLALAVFCLAVAAIFGVMAAAGWRVRGSRARTARIPCLFLHYVTMQAALLAGFVRFVRGDLAGHWHRTPRGGAPAR